MQKPEAKNEREKMRLLKMVGKRWMVIAVLSILAPLNTASALDGQDEEPLFEQLSATFKKEYLSFGALLQTVGDFQIDRSFSGNNGFSIANFRLSVAGELDQGFGYFLQANFVSSTSILDASMYYKPSDDLAVEIGLFKAPFSKEFLTLAASIDFVNRSQVVSALAPGRQIGVQITGWLAQRFIRYSFGLFNGNGFAANNNDDNNFLYAGRVTIFPGISNEAGATEKAEFGLNIAVSEDENTTLGGGFLSDFSGVRFLLGGDFRWSQDHWLLAGEAIYARLNPDFGTTTHPFGFHATVGFMLRPKTQVVLRWDGLEADGIRADSHLIIVGLNHWPTQATEFQVNYIIPTSDGGIDNNQVLINAQLGF